MDAQTQRTLVGTLGLALLVTIVGAVALAWAGRDVPEQLWPLGTGLVGALAGLAVPKAS